MTERPILFSGPMIRAILAGKKTQTRRIVDVARVAKKGTLDSAGWRPFNLDDAADRRAVETNTGHVCPYGAIGDRLWVRETHALHHAWDARKTPAKRGKCAIWYRADADPNVVDGRGRWRPSIFTKRWMARITLPVESIRIERLNAITKGDAIAEGVETLGKVTDPRGAFVALWDSINAERASWQSNPWVWVVSFPRVAP